MEHSLSGAGQCGEVTNTASDKDINALDISSIELPTVSKPSKHIETFEMQKDIQPLPTAFLFTASNRVIYRCNEYIDILFTGPHQHLSRSDAEPTKQHHRMSIVTL